MVQRRFYITLFVQKKNNKFCIWKVKHINRCNCDEQKDKQQHE